MPLTNCRVGAAVTIADMGRARSFYDGKVGLTTQSDDPDGNLLGLVQA